MFLKWNTKLLRLNLVGFSFSFAFHHQLNKTMFRILSCCSYSHILLPLVIGLSLSQMLCGSLTLTPSKAITPFDMIRLIKTAFFDLSGAIATTFSSLLLLLGLHLHHSWLNQVFLIHHFCLFLHYLQLLLFQVEKSISLGLLFSVLFD